MYPDGIAQRLSAVRAQMAAAAQAAGRAPEAVQLVAVSKTFGAEAVAEAYAAGQRHFGENRVQELVAKAQALAHLPELQWHLIGPLQTNKAKYLSADLPTALHRLHTLDSARLLAELERQAARAGRTFSCLIQLNISGEAQKSGTDVAGAQALLAALPAHPHVQVRGLMGMAEFTDDAARVRAQFDTLAAAQQQLQAATGLALPELSMGMSGDYPQAIAAGATWVRVGSAIFGAR